jgi:hypothetical protein
LGTGLLYGLHIRRTSHNLPRRPSAGLLTTVNAAGANGLTCLPKHGGSKKQNKKRAGIELKVDTYLLISNKHKFIKKYILIGQFVTESLKNKQ